MNNKILIAKIVAAQGIKGQVRVDVYSDKPENLKKYKTFYLKNGDEIKLKPDFFKNKQAICTILNIKDRTTAEKLVGNELFIEKASLEQPKQNEFYISDLVSLKVVDFSTKKEVGHVAAIYNFGAGDIIEVEFSEQKTKSGKAKLQMFAFNDDYFPEVNTQNGFVLLNQKVK
jgi:16S rRNA processing protein RimM